MRLHNFFRSHPLCVRSLIMMDGGGILMRNEKIEISSLPRNESVIISLFRIFIHEKLDESLPGPSNDVILFMKNETSSIFRRERKKKSFTNEALRHILFCILLRLSIGSNFPHWINEKLFLFSGFIFIAHDTESLFVLHDVICENSCSSGVASVLVPQWHPHSFAPSAPNPSAHHSADCSKFCTVSNNNRVGGWLGTSTFSPLLRSYDVIENWLRKFFASWNFHGSELGTLSWRRLGEPVRNSCLIHRIPDDFRHRTLRIPKL